MVNIVKPRDREVGVALIGTGFMGKCHAMAWRNVATVFGGTPPRLEVLCEIPEEKAQELSHSYGFRSFTDDWKASIDDTSVDVVSVTTPNKFHREMAEYTLEAGKHLWLEKPMALTLEDAQAMTDLAKAKPQLVTQLGYSYLRNPAIRAAGKIITSGQIGDARSFRGVCDEDYCADPDLEWSWRMSHAQGGLGALGDLGCHLVSLATELMGPIADVTARSQINVKQRPHDGELRDVENEDSVTALVSFVSGAHGMLATSRVAHGRKNRLQFEIQGTLGTIVFDQESMGEIWVFRSGDRGFTRHLIGPDDPDFRNFCPAPGHSLGFNELKVIEARDLLVSIDSGQPPSTDFTRGMEIERVIHAMATSNGRPVCVGESQ